MDRDIVGYKLIGKLVVPCFDILEWARWYETADRVVGKTQVGPLTVSTVFLGLDHGWGKRSRFFETMVFGDRTKMVELVPGKKRLFRSTPGNYEVRYETWAEAEAGHQTACAWAQEQLDKLEIDFASGRTPRQTTDRSGA
jgi:hypothetical protein